MKNTVAECKLRDATLVCRWHIAMKLVVISKKKSRSAFVKVLLSYIIFILLVHIFINRADLYSEESITLSDIRFEQASILHNLGKMIFLWYFVCIVYVALKPIVLTA
jgi:hypothetical protein